MYVDSAYWHNKALDFKDKRHSLFVTSCGTYRLLTKPKLPTNRPRGRIDYQILYIASGKAHFYFNGIEEIVAAGNMVIYRPKEEQRYYYYGADHTEVYWVHFTGSNVKNILRKYGIPDKAHVIHTGTSLEYKHIFLQMIRELKLCKEDYEELLVNYLKQLLIMLHRLMGRKPKGRNRLLMEEMDSAVSYFHENYNKPISIEEYAAGRHMSISWFIRNFKEYTEATPAQYIQSLRISNAQTLLETTNYNVSEIAQILGYDDPFYFSRVFKKQSGLSPTEFRRQLQQDT
ncbi:AraC family transcriptional regulator [Luxibacter massiliensis]|uniref:AraC family transcriptional regulator n=1 Tax=Luxibacter massiliensis TaxID=2219695 RepID=UPI000F055864|nr:AraC family transcriptional regulator [Luxibacter massiliensis]